MSQFFVVDFDEPGVLAKGKGSPQVIRRFCRSLSRLGVHSEILPFSELLKRGAPQDPASYVLLHYNELFVVQNRKVSWLRARENELRALGYHLLHSVEVGRIVGNKKRQNQVLTKASVPMPAMLTGSEDFDVAFSNAVSDAHVPVQLLDQSETLDDRRYNTEYVDCRHEFDGKLWHVCIRAQAVGGQVLFSWIRAGQEPSVHSRDTPVDSKLINHFHDKIIRPRTDEIQQIAERIKDALGVGLYAHDILPCARTGKLLLCETNFKFYDGLHRFHMSPIANTHPTPAVFDGAKVARRIARALVSELSL